MDSFNNNKTVQDHKNLTCYLCTRYYNNPRILPCRHIFCSSCIKTLFDKSTVTYLKNKKISCPTCKACVDVPAEGIEGFPLDHKTQAMKEKAIQDLAQNISKSMKNPKEETSSRFSNTSPLGDMKFNHDPRTTGNRETDSNPSSAYRDFSKYAKYFNKESNIDSEYKPSIRADHTRLGYESSTRFRNRRVNSKERQGSEEKELKRRTWYGSTLQSRRAQSLNRASMFVDEQQKTNSENLFKISEDKEQTIPGMTTGDSGQPSFKRSNVTSRYKINGEKADYLRPKSAKSNDFEDTQNKEFMSNSGGPARTALPTHRENIVTGSFVKHKSKENTNSPDEPEMSFRRSKSSPKRTYFQDKNFTSPETRQETNSRRFECSDKSFGSSDKEEPKTFVGSRHRRFKKSQGINDDWKDKKNQFECDSNLKSFSDHGRAHSVASRDKLHLDIDSNEQNESLEHGFRQQDPSPRRSRSRKVKNERCRSVDSRYSLNKNDFNSESEFREHLLNMKMSKEKYQHMMEDLKNEQLNDMRSDSCGFDADPEDLQEERNKEDDKENIKQNMDSESSENILTDVPLKPPREPLIDENLISSFRVKYSSPLDIKRFPKQEMCPDYCESVAKCWSYQKNEYGIPTSAVFLSSGNLVVSEYGLSCLEFFDASGHLEHNITGIKPYGLSLSTLNQNIIVGDRKGRCIRIFDEFGADVSQIDNLENVEWLAGIATGRDGGLILCDRGRCKILICNTAGEKIREFGSFGSNAKQLCMADFLTVDSKGRILVADSGNHCIKIFDSDGNFLKAVGSRGNEDGQMEWPKGIAVDQDDNIIVADTLNHRISLFSSDGLFVKHLMTSIPDPYNITYSGGRLGVLHYNLNGMSQYDVFTC